MRTLFEQEEKIVTLEMLRNSNFKFFKSGMLLNDENSSIIKKYYEKIYCNDSCIPFYHCLPLYNGITNDRKFRFLLVSIGGELVFFAYKIIQILKTSQIRVFDKPISLNGNTKLEHDVTCALLSLPFVRFVFSSNVVLKADLNNAKRLFEYDNYYYTRHSFLNNIPKWKLNKYGIHLVENGDFHVTIKSIPMLDALKIRNDFNRYLLENGHKIAKKDDATYRLIMSSKNNRIKTLAIYYKKEIIYLRVMIVYEELGVAYALYDMQTRYYDKTNKILNKVLSHNMVEKIKYFTFSLFENINIVYILGCRPSEHRLLSHKEVISDGKIEYFIL